MCSDDEKTAATQSAKGSFLLTLLELMPQTLLRNFLRTLLMDFFANFAQIIFLYVTEKHFIFCYPKA